jgi:hypothetical protein
MHYQLEIIMPSVDDVDASVTEILRQFDENAGGEDISRHAFWDYWAIGGRWSGNKLRAILGEDRIAAFREVLHERRITVSAVTFGKQTLQPASQAELVNRLWNDAFPDSPVKICPLFDNYKVPFGDIMTLKDCPRTLECSHVIIAGPRYDGSGLEAKFMLERSLWNGVTHQDTKWDGILATALEDWAKRMEGYKPDYAEKVTPTADWLVVTVDYHS